MAKVDKQTSSTLKCSTCQVEVTSETYAEHIRTAHPPLQNVNDEWTGSTNEVILPTLASQFWSVGMKISGKLDGYREISFRDNSGATRNGVAYRLILDNPVTINGESEGLVELPPLTGILAAFKSLKIKGYNPEKGDLWSIKCTEIRKSTRAGFSDSPNFSITATRPKF